MIETVNEDTAEILSILEKYGISSFDHFVVRNENYYLYKLIDPGGNQSNQYDYTFAYGLSIMSENKINVSELNNINSDLGNVGYGYELKESWSLSDISKGVQLINNESYIIDAHLSMYGILIGFAITMLFILIFFKWHGAASVIITVLMETLAAFGLTMLMFTPFGPTFWISLLIFTTFSLIFKSIVLTDVRHQLNYSKKINEEIIFKSYKENSKILLHSTVYLFSFLVLLWTIPIMFLGSGAFFGLVFITLGGIMLAITNTFIFPVITTKLAILRINKKNKIQELDEIYSKQDNVVDEEYIKNINK